MATTFRFLDDEYAIAPVRRAGTVTLAVDDTAVNVAPRGTDAGCQRCVIDGVPREAFVARDGDTVFVHLDGEVWEVIPAPEFGGSFIHPSALRSYGLDVTYQF